MTEPTVTIEAIREVLNQVEDLWNLRRNAPRGCDFGQRHPGGQLCTKCTARDTHDSELAEALTPAIAA